MKENGVKESGRFIKCCSDLKFTWKSWGRTWRKSG